MFCGEIEIEGKWQRQNKHETNRFLMKKEKWFQEGKTKRYTTGKKEQRHEKEKAQQKEIHDVWRKMIKKKKVATKQKYREEKTRGLNQRRFKNKNEAEVKKSTKRKQLKGSKRGSNACWWRSALKDRKVQRHVRTRTRIRRHVWWRVLPTWTRAMVDCPAAVGWP